MMNVQTRPDEIERLSDDLTRTLVVIEDIEAMMTCDMVNSGDGDVLRERFREKVVV